MVRRAFKTLLAGALLSRGAYWTNARRRRAMPVLCYHRISDQPDPLGLAVSEAEFAWQMKLLAESPHVRPVSATEFTEVWRGRRDYGARIPVLVSFDDGFRDNLTLAAPVLKRHGISAIVFVITDVLQGRPPWYDLVERLVSAQREPALRDTLAARGLPRAHAAAPHGAAAWVNWLLELDGATFVTAIEAIRGLPVRMPPADRYLSPHDLGDWLAQGMEVGAHTCTHPRLTALEPAAAEWELAQSKRILEVLIGRPVSCLAYPFGRRGDFTPAHAHAAAKVGYAMAFTTVQGGNRVGDDPFLVRRKCVNGGLFSRSGGGFSESLYMADLMGLGAELRQGMQGVLRGMRHVENTGG